MGVSTSYFLAVKDFSLVSAYSTSKSLVWDATPSPNICRLGTEDTEAREGRRSSTYGSALGRFVAVIGLMTAIGSHNEPISSIAKEDRHQWLCFIIAPIPHQVPWPYSIVSFRERETSDVLRTGGVEGSISRGRADH